MVSSQMCPCISLGRAAEHQRMQHPWDHRPAALPRAGGALGVGGEVSLAQSTAGTGLWASWLTPSSSPPGLGLCRVLAMPHLHPVSSLTEPFGPQIEKPSPWGRNPHCSSRPRVPAATPHAPIHLHSTLRTGIVLESDPQLTAT